MKSSYVLTKSSSVPMNSGSAFMKFGLIVLKVMLFFAFMLMTVVGFAQEQQKLQGVIEPVKQEGIVVSLGHSQVKDENLHPKAFRGLTVGAVYEYSFRRANILEYTAGLQLGALNTTYEEFPSAAEIMIKGDFKYLWHIAHKGNVVFFAGPAAGLHYGTFAFFNWDESHFYYANYLATGIACRASYITFEKTIDLSLDIPLVSLMSRPVLNRPYKIDDMTFGGILENLADNPELALPDKNFYVNSGLEVNYSTKKGKARSVGCLFSYHWMHSPKGNRYQQIGYSLLYKFIF